MKQEEPVPDDFLYGIDRIYLIIEDKSLRIIHFRMNVISYTMKGF